MQKSETPLNGYDEQNDQFKPGIPEFTEFTTEMFEEDKHEGMYETLQIKLGKTYLELHKMIAAL